jgi:hypothetical protein
MAIVNVFCASIACVEPSLYVATAKLTSACAAATRSALPAFAPVTAASSARSCSLSESLCSSVVARSAFVWSSRACAEPARTCPTYEFQIAADFASIPSWEPSGRLHLRDLGACAVHHRTELQRIEFLLSLSNRASHLVADRGIGVSTELLYRC